MQNSDENHSGKKHSRKERRDVKQVIIDKLLNDRDFLKSATSEAKIQQNIGITVNLSPAREAIISLNSMGLVTRTGDGVQRPHLDITALVSYHGFGLMLEKAAIDRIFKKPPGERLIIGTELGKIVKKQQSVAPDNFSEWAKADMEFLPALLRLVGLYDIATPFEQTLYRIRIAQNIRETPDQQREITECNGKIAQAVSRGNANDVEQLVEERLKLSLKHALGEDLPLDEALWQGARSFMGTPKTTQHEVPGVG